MNSIQIIAFTHRQFNFEEIGLFHLDDNRRIEKLTQLKTTLKIDELMYLSTCNRVEFIISKEKKIDKPFIKRLVSNFLNKEDINLSEDFVNKAEVFSNKKAIHHVFSVASSIDSLVVGEREIITQVRKAFEECRDNNLCGDLVRVLVQMTISTAKKVYTESDIGTRPVSIVSLAFLELKKFISKRPKKILVIGAGKTIASMLKFISKNQHHQYIIYNRSKEKAENLIHQLSLDAKAYSLDQLDNKPIDFDFIVSCTGSKEIILTEEKFNKINPNHKKSIIVDLAVPKDCDIKITNNPSVKLINVDQLKVRAEENLKARGEEVKRCLDIIEKQIIKYYISEKERKLERALSSVPKSIKGIRQKAFREVFAKELEALDPGAIEVVNSLVDYIEKKYISVPMKMAREILLKETTK